MAPILLKRQNPEWWPSKASWLGPLQLTPYSFSRYLIYSSHTRASRPYILPSGGIHTSSPVCTSQMSTCLHPPYLQVLTQMLSSLWDISSRPYLKLQTFSPPPFPSWLFSLVLNTVYTRPHTNWFPISHLLHPLEFKHHLSSIQLNPHHLDQSLYIVGAQ